MRLARARALKGAAHAVERTRERARKPEKGVRKPKKLADEFRETREDVREP